MIKIEIKYNVKIIENRNKIHYFISGIEIFNFYFNFIDLLLSLYPILVIHYELYSLNLKFLKLNDKCYILYIIICYIL